MDVPDRLLLPLRVDVEPLATEAAALPEEDWVPHFNTAYYSGDWSGVALRAVGGEARRLYPDPAATEPYADTEVLDRCPHLRAFLDRLECEKNAARLLRLGPGARVREHRDYRLGYADGEVRLHVPITTGPGVVFVLSGSEVPMAPGDCWYVDVNCPHSVANDGDAPRVHLVVDCVVDRWVEEMVHSALPPAADPD